MITISGPEKAGKTTLVAEVKRQLLESGEPVFSRHWPKPVSDLEFLEGLKVDMEKVAAGEWVLWDRSWICEHVYSKLLHRDGRFGQDPWLAQWLYGRAVDTVGVQAVLLPTVVEQLSKRRDETDHPVDPIDEYGAYFQYARDFHIERLYNMYRSEDVRMNAGFLIQKARWVCDMVTALPPTYAGPPHAATVVVGEVRNEKSALPGSWLPFTSPMTTQFARMLGADAFRLGWTNAAEINPVALRKEGRTFITCGEKATTFARFYVNAKSVLDVPHPSYLFRWGRAKALIPEVSAQVARFIA
jgi:hypothetical protein